MRYEAQLKSWALEKALLTTTHASEALGVAEQFYAYAYSPDVDLLENFKKAMELLASVGNAGVVIKEMLFLIEQAQIQLGVNVATITPVETKAEVLND